MRRERTYYVVAFGYCSRHAMWRGCEGHWPDCEVVTVPVAEPKWEYRMADITWGGTLSTAGDLVFGGGKEGYFVALDARSGAELWRMPVGGQVNSGPMSYAVSGKQYVAVAAGNALFAFALPSAR